MNRGAPSTAAANGHAPPSTPQPKPIRFVTNHDGPYAKRRRINSACLTCRRKKTRCSGGWTCSELQCQCVLIQCRRTASLWDMHPEQARMRRLWRRQWRSRGEPRQQEGSPQGEHCVDQRARSKERTFTRPSYPARSTTAAPHGLVKRLPAVRFVYQ